jgi:ABC-2 type transport system permease protein
MNSHFADAAAGEAPREFTPGARIGAGSTLAMLVRREFWEHRALWIAPLVVAALMVVSAFVASVKYSLTHADMHHDGSDGMTMFSVMQSAVSMPLALVTLIVLSFYLLDCLYAERKDRSILFWKSLPVSDNLTVLSKLLVALLVVPLGVFALGLLVSLSFVGIWELNAAFGRLPPIPGWDTLAWLKGEMALLACVIVGVLWYAPFAAYLLVVSAWARRSPFLWASVPVVLAPLLERMAFGTTYLWKLLAYRTYGIWHTLFPYPHLGHGRADALASMFGQLRFGAAFSDIDLWLGLAVTAALVFAAIRLRRYRDDT